MLLLFFEIVKMKKKFSRTKNQSTRKPEKGIGNPMPSNPETSGNPPLIFLAEIFAFHRPGVGAVPGGWGGAGGLGGQVGRREIPGKNIPGPSRWGFHPRSPITRLKFLCAKTPSPAASAHAA